MSIRSETHQWADNTQSSTTPISMTSSQSLSDIVSPTPSQPKPVTDKNSVLTAMRSTEWMTIVWAGVSVFFFLRLIAGIGAIWHISARSNHFSWATEQLISNQYRHVSVRLSNRVKVPMVWGFLRPVILLPANAAHWKTDRIRAVLLHELAHIKRWDWVMQTIAQVTCAVHWFNPLLWFTARQMRIDAEQACDDQVLNAGFQSIDYAQHLLDIVRNVKTVGPVSRAAVAIARSSKIEGRLRTVLAENQNRHPVTTVAVGIGILVLTCFTVPMGAMRLAQAVNPEETLSKKFRKSPRLNRYRASSILIKLQKHHRLTKTLKSASSIWSKLARQSKHTRRNTTIFPNGSLNFIRDTCQMQTSCFVQRIKSVAKHSIRRT